MDISSPSSKNLKPKTEKPKIASKVTSNYGTLKYIGEVRQISKALSHKNNGGGSSGCDFFDGQNIAPVPKAFNKSCFDEITDKCCAENFLTPIKNQKMTVGFDESYSEDIETGFVYTTPIHLRVPQIPAPSESTQKAADKMTQRYLKDRQKTSRQKRGGGGVNGSSPVLQRKWERIPEAAKVLFDDFENQALKSETDSDADEYF